MEIMAKLVRALRNSELEVFCLNHGDIKLACKALSFTHKGKKFKLTIFAKGLISHYQKGETCLTQESIQSKTGICFYYYTENWRLKDEEILGRFFIYDLAEDLKKLHPEFNVDDINYQNRLTILAEDLKKLHPEFNVDDIDYQSELTVLINAANFSKFELQ